MDIRLVEDFLDLCRTCNFSETAENRFVTQPTLSRRIKQLEDWLGAPLIERHIRPVQLTNEGHAFFPIAQEMLHWVTTAQQRLEGSLTSATASSVTAPRQDTDHSVSLAGEEPKASADIRHIDDGKENQQSYRIMLIDDSEVSLMVLAKLIEDEGHSCTTFLSAEDALEAMETQQWDMALCDYRMPGIDGAGFADRVREIEAAKQADPMPIVGVSTSTDLDSIFDCFQAGMNDYLCKPVGVTEMRVALDRWLPQSRTLEATELDALNDQLTSGLGNKELVSSFCASIRQKVVDVSEAIELANAETLHELLPTIRDEAYMTGAYSFARTCIQLLQTAQSDSMRKLLEKRGPFLCEFVRLVSAVTSETNPKSQKARLA